MRIFQLVYERVQAFADKVNEQAHALFLREYAPQACLGCVNVCVWCDMCSLQALGQPVIRLSETALGYSA